MKQFRIRASACGTFMTNDRSGKAMGETAKTACEIWVKEQIYGRRKEISTKYMEKGIIMEDDAIDLLASEYDLGFVLKNEKYYENEFIHGTPDIVLSDKIIDVKCSYDCFSFPLFEKQIPTKAYYYQLQCYMHLTGLKQAWLAYMLMDTPTNIIEREARNYAYNNGFDEVDDEMMQSFIARMTYGNIPTDKRIKLYEIDYDADVIKAIYNRVEQCREYIATL